MSITLKELIKSTDFNKLPKDIQSNLMILLEKINKVRDSYGKAMTVTSGLRTKEDQIAIYAKKGITDKNKVPMGSQHIQGAAVDIYDPDQKLQKWCKDNEKFLETTGLWMEDFSATKNWVHFQIFPPKSGKRWFLP